MRKTKKSGNYIKFLMYIVVVVLVNLAGLTLFFRWDLTKNRVYSLSRASREVVSTLEEPLSIKVFFTKNLPAPHNNTERYLHDLLEEYAVFGKKNFNYTFYNVSPDEGEISVEKKENRELANNYGIFPVQIQAVEGDEVKFQRAFMGMVLIHGDLIEKIPTITSTDGLEYDITMAVKKMNNKISALLGLKVPIKVRLFMSSSLNKVAPLMQLDRLPGLPDTISTIVDKLNGIHYGKLEYQHLDPTVNPDLSAMAARYNVMNLKWPDDPGKNIQQGNGSIGLVMQHGEKSLTIPLMQAINLPLIGTHYQMIESAQLEEVIGGAAESLIDINEDLGILADHGALPATSGASPMMPRQGGGPSMGLLRSLLGRSYTVKDVLLKDDHIPDGMNALIIPRPTEPFTEYELLRIDQFLMKGKSLVIFLDPFKEEMPPAMMGGQGPTYTPLDTGLEKLLDHYGLRIRKSIVLDENCYRQAVPQNMGGGERALYFAPMIQNRNINHDIDFMKSIKGLVALKAAPIDVDTERIEKLGITAEPVFSSSDKSWEMKDNINLNPMFMMPPTDGEQQKSFPLAFLLKGEFPSYFDGKSLPVKTVEQAAETEDNTGEDISESDTADAASIKKPAGPDLSGIEGSGGFVAKGKPGRIFVMAASDMLTDSVIDEQGRGPNALFVLNMIDGMNHREDVAMLRGKTQGFNPLAEIGSAAKLAIKSFNIVGLPILTVLFGMFVWLRRNARKKQIQMMFQER